MASKPRERTCPHTYAGDAHRCDECLRIENERLAGEVERLTTRLANANKREVQMAAFFVWDEQPGTGASRVRIPLELKGEEPK